jgi:hypothetical protein
VRQHGFARDTEDVEIRRRVAEAFVGSVVIVKDCSQWSTSCGDRLGYFHASQRPAKARVWA